MFVFEEDYCFDWPVKVAYPTGGGEEIREFTARFRLPADELQIFEPDKDPDDKAAEDNAAPPAPTDIRALIARSRDRLAQYWIGWTGIETPAGTPLPFSEDTRARLLKQRPIRLAIDAALSEAILGIREKN
ncbi:hypothetical protein RGUI_0843 [Rhodovulum sp. P5]|uniref:tail length tape measure protein n=1 Tax=Rhodovulum phage vB_RhkS_P1 TaxID=1873452 RepID=UPI00080AB06D|nr:hypothetical protein [Rhodovulum sp. P5]YP_009285930.1 tail length tape measure protein [Rhodovulum phage vB_RhkS_P1]ANT39916.1 hypothetical protein Rhks_45 [Rhodovulum phage vB_RhkS_P1]ARE38984.1 hypothetical protein RGUI_0843 [Rhodovulum sp. P5]